MSDPLIDSLRYRPVATTAAQMREAADRIERLEHELAAWLQVWDNVHLDVPELGTSNKPLAVAATYELIKRERDAAIAEAEALRKEAARADYVRKAFLLDDNDAIFEFCLAESVAEFNAAIDAVLATRVPDAAIAKEQKP